MGSCRSHILSNVPCEAFKIPYDRLLVTGGLSGQVWLVCLVPWVTRAGTYQSKHWPIWRLIWSFFPKKSKVWHTLDLVRCFKIDKDTLNAQGTLEISDNWYIHWKRNENISRIMSRGGYSGGTFNPNFWQNIPWIWCFLHKNFTVRTHRTAGIML